MVDNIMNLFKGRKDKMTDEDKNKMTGIDKVENKEEVLPPKTGN